MSFSQKVKEEIISKINSQAKADACLYGMLICANTLDENEITLLTETECIADFFVLNVERICGNNSVDKSVKGKRSASPLYSLSVLSYEKRVKLLEYFHIGQNRKQLKSNYPKPSLYPQYIGGMFLACGSISDPNKGYQMEFVMPDLDLCNEVGLILIENYGMLAKNVERRNRQILYFKESDNIIDMTALMGAVSASFELTDVKIFKDIRNNTNREVNCVSANIEKSVRASKKQISDIKLIESMVGLDSLADNLREAAKLRLDNPELNLTELGLLIDPPISRSGMNHRFKKIAEIADSLRV